MEHAKRQKCVEGPDMEDLSPPPSEPLITRNTRTLITIRQILAANGIVDENILARIGNHFPDHTAEKYKYMVMRSAKKIFHVPPEYITVEIIIIAFDLYTGDKRKLFNKLDSRIPTERFEKILNELVKIRSNVLIEIPKKYLNDELVWIAMSCPIFTVQHLPSKYQTNEIYDAFSDLAGSGDVYGSCKTQAYSNDLFFRGSVFWCIPEEFRISELSIIMIRRGCASLGLIPERFLTKDIIMAAVIGNVPVSEIPEKFLSYEVYREIGIRGRIYDITEVPEKFRTLEIYQYAIESKIANFYAIPDHHKTYELCIIAVKRGASISHVPEKFRSYELCVEMCKHQKVRIGVIPTEFHTPEIMELLEGNRTIESIEDIFDDDSCKEFIITYPEKFRDVPKKFITADVCQYVALSMTVPWYYIDSKYLTADIYLKRILNNKNSAFYEMERIILRQYHTFLPEKYYCEEIFVGLAKDLSSNIDLSHVPHKFRSTLVCEAFYMRSHCNLKFIPEDSFTDEIISKLTNDEFKHLPHKFRTQDVYYNAFSQKRIKFNMIPHEFLTSTICEQYMQKSRSLNYIPDEFHTLDLHKKYITYILSTSFPFNLPSENNMLNEIPKKYHTQELRDFLAVSFRPGPNSMRRRN